MKTLDIVITNIDRLGMLMAQAADLNEQIEALKDSIKNQGEGNYEGNLYKANVKLSQRKVVDYKTIIAELDVPSNLVDAHTTTTASITLKVTAR
jgi:hypothetical protein